MEPTKDIENKKISSKQKKIIIIIVTVIFAIYIAGVIYFQNHFLFGTKMSGKNIGGKTISAVETLLANHTKNYKLTITGRKDLKDTISGSDIDLEISLGKSIESGMKEQNPFLWFIGATGEHKNLTADISYNEKKLTKTIQQLIFFKKENVVEPVNATVVLKKDKFVTQKEVLGTTVDKKKLTKEVTDCLPEIQTTLDLDEAKCYVSPTIYEDDDCLDKAIEQADKYADVTITYDFDYTTETVGKSLIQKWIVFDEEANVDLDYERVLTYIEELAEKYDTYSSIRKVKDASGNEHTIYFGSYGWKISQTKETKQLIKVIKKGKDVKREPIYMYEAVCRKKGNIDWDDTYALVSIQNQSMVYIKDGEVAVSSSVVTGDITKGHGTPTGAYAVMYKERDQTLVGQNYASPVSYWMPFTTNTGFHDASWRSSFGGSIYKGNGSHGCVNMPAGNAAALYSVIEPGVPVFVY
ncbi:MAG: peptidoglycan binding domain-containing protein [Lachnospiraceae bacterium]|nr:peptidoglycan binding domain-containing protein [Lachnospiraceae bacterium]